MKCFEFEPDIPAIQKWIDALRSGKYSQTFDVLQDNHGYCCLGVACEVLIPKARQRREPCSPTKLREPAVSSVLRGHLPMDQPSAPEWLAGVNKYVEAVLGKSLSELNDSHDMAFEQVADLLQILFIEGAAYEMECHMCENEGIVPYIKPTVVGLHD